MADVPTLIAIASAGHAGSTLLDLPFGNHSQVCSAGEMNRLTLHAPDRMCACGDTVTHCAFWEQVRVRIALSGSRQRVRHWHECRTDVPGEVPIARLHGASLAELIDGASLPASLRVGLQEAGLPVGDGSYATLGGVPDRKWRVRDSKTRETWVLRDGGGSVDVYSSSVPSKNPLRLMPEPLEIVLALGAATSLQWLRRRSPSVARYSAIAENSWAVADAMAAATGMRYVVDSSKSPLRLKLMYMLRPAQVRIVHLVRDGRAVAASAMRRRDMPAGLAARVWKRDNRNLAVMLRSIPAGVKLGIRYEALCEEPERELRRVCDFLALEYEPGMSTLWDRPVHNIPGNPMPFDRTRRSIRKDERWRRDLSEGDIRAFERAAGVFNRSLGYV